MADSRCGRRVAACIVAVVAAMVVVLSVTPAVAENRRSQQWFLDSLRIPNAHSYSTGRRVTVAVIDSGIYADHPDLKGHVLKGVDLNELAAAKYGWKDDNGHGTAMAGIIAAQGGGQEHVAGIAPGVMILPIRVPESGVSPTQMAKAIHYAVDHNASVINISYRVQYSSYPALTSSVKYALSHDVIVVAAAGNVSADGRRLIVPARVPGVIAVTGTNRNENFWPGSSSGRRAVLAAPATKIVSANTNEYYPSGSVTPKKTSGYSISTGTSDAAAIVSGVAALVRARYPKLSADDVINRLIKTADDRGPKGRDPEYGYGIVDPVRALTASVPHVGRNPLGEPKVRATAASPTVAADSGNGSGEGVGMLVGIGFAVVLVGGIVASVLAARRRRASG